jgi:hypothetical protein
MESNAEDKMMREKLKGVEFPFEQASWDKMEAMLGKEEKKRRGFFWWWFSGAALFTLLASGVGYLLLNPKASNEQLLVNGNNPHEINSTLSENSNNTTAPVASISPVSEDKQAEAQTNFTALEQQNSSQNIPAKTAQIKNNLTHNQPTAKIENNTKSINQSKAAEIITGTQTATLNSALVPVSESNKTGQENSLSTTNSELNATSQAEVIQPVSVANATNVNEQGGGGVKEENAQAIVAESEVPASIPSSISIPEEVKTEDITIAVADSSAEEKQPESKPAPDQQKVKKKMAFNYALGAMGGVTASVLKSNPDKNIREGIYKKPSFSVGFVQEFILAKRVGIVSGVMYSQTSYDVDSPKTWTLPNRPSYYSSSVSEIQIPIGLKVYPVVKDNFRFFISAGVINHIKINENFTYAGPNVDTIEEPNKTVVTNTMFPEQTDFSGTGFGQNTSYDVFNGLSTTPSTTSQIVNTDDFAINGVSRYYTSFYASMGVDFVVKKHLVISAEPTFFMLLQKVGVQEKRKYNFGLNVGMKYMFGL